MSEMMNMDPEIDESRQLDRLGGPGEVVDIRTSGGFGNNRGGGSTVAAQEVRHLVAVLLNLLNRMAITSVILGRK